MSDVFISYASEDRDRAEAIAQAFQKQGLTVWWDRNIPFGEQFDKAIQEALDKAKCVIVLWSKVSVQSDFVKEEAQRGATRDILVPVRIDDVEIPLGFGRIQTADLIHWRGGLTHDEFKGLSRSVAQKLGGELDSRRMELVQPAEDKVEPGTEAAQQTTEEETREKAEEEARQRAEAARVAEAVQPPERPAATPWLLQLKRWFSPTIAVLTVVVVVFVSAAAYFFIQRNAAFQELEALRTGETVATVSDTELVRDYEKFRETYSVYLYFDPTQADEVKGKIKEFKASAAAFAKFKQDDESNSLPAGERLDLWENFQPKRPVSVEAQFKADRVAALKRVVEQLAELSDREKDTTVSDAELAELVAAYDTFLNTHRDNLSSAETDNVKHKIVAFEELKNHRAREADATVSDAELAELVAAYDTFLNTHRDHVDSAIADAVEHKIAAFEELKNHRAREADATVSDAELASEYEEFQNEYSGRLDSAIADAVEHKIAAFKASAAAFAKLKQDDESDSLPAGERLARWQKYQPPRNASPEAKEKGARVAPLKRVVEKLAELRGREKDAAVRDIQLVTAYQGILNTNRGHLNPAEVAEVKRKIKVFSKSAAAFAKLKQDDESDSLPAGERLARWQKYQPPRNASPEAKEKGARVAALKQDLEQLKAEAARQFSDLSDREKDTMLSDDKLAQDYEKFLEIHRSHLDPVMATRVTDRIKELETSATAFDELRRRDESDSLTVSERLDLWGKYHPARGASFEATFKADRVGALKRELEQ